MYRRCLRPLETLRYCLFFAAFISGPASTVYTLLSCRASTSSLSWGGPEKLCTADTAREGTPRVPSGRNYRTMDFQSWFLFFQAWILNCTIAAQVSLKPMRFASWNLHFFLQIFLAVLLHLNPEFMLLGPPIPRPRLWNRRAALGNAGKPFSLRWNPLKLQWEVVNNAPESLWPFVLAGTPPEWVLWFLHQVFPDNLNKTGPTCSKALQMCWGNQRRRMQVEVTGPEPHLLALTLAGESKTAQKVALGRTQV